MIWFDWEHFVKLTWFHFIWFVPVPDDKILFCLKKRWNISRFYDLSSSCLTYMDNLQESFSFIAWKLSIKIIQGAVTPLSHHEVVSFCKSLLSYHSKAWNKLSTFSGNNYNTECHKLSMAFNFHISQLLKYCTAIVNITYITTKSSKIWTFYVLISQIKSQCFYISHITGSPLPLTGVSLRPCLGGASQQKASHSHYCNVHHSDALQKWMP